MRKIAGLYCLTFSVTQPGPSRVNLPRAWRVRGVWERCKNMIGHWWSRASDLWGWQNDRVRQLARSHYSNLLIQLNQNVWQRRQSSGTIWNNGKNYCFRKTRKAFPVVLCFINKIMRSSSAWNCLHVWKDFALRAQVWCVIKFILFHDFDINCFVVILLGENI